jgi:hypothetical protein
VTPDQIVCRLCKRDYGDSAGCPTCGPAKASIVWPSLRDTDSTDLVQASRRIVKMLDQQCKALQKEIKLVPGTGYHPELAKDAALLSRALASVLTEARKLEEAEEKRVKGGGFDDQLEIFLEWLAGLPKEYQAKALNGMEGLLLPGEVATLED